MLKLINVEPVNIIEEIHEKLVEINSIFDNQNNNALREINESTTYKSYKAYFEQSKEHVLTELYYKLPKSLNRLLKKETLNLICGATALIGSCNEMRNIFPFYLKAQAEGQFNGTVFEKGIFMDRGNLYLTALKNPPACLFFSKDCQKTTQNNSIASATISQEQQPLLFLFDKYYLATETCGMIINQEALQNYILQKEILTEQKMEQLKAFFYKTLPYVIDDFIKRFYKNYLSYEGDSFFSVSTPIINIGKSREIVILLETLYQELFKQSVFSDTILSTATTEITRGNATYFNEILNTPFDDYPYKDRYYLRLTWNPFNIRPHN